jgi:hypothetical protein
MLRHHVGTQRRFSYCGKPERLCPLSPKPSGPPEPRRSLTVTSLRPIAASCIFKDRPAIGIAPVSATVDRQVDGVAAASSEVSCAAPKQRYLSWWRVFAEEKILDLWVLIEPGKFGTTAFGNTARHPSSPVHTHSNDPFWPHRPGKHHPHLRWPQSTVGPQKLNDRRSAPFTLAASARQGRPAVFASACPLLRRSRW